MKYNIRINQEKLSKYKYLDLIDACILDYLYIIGNSRNDKIKAMRIDNYTWVDYNSILKDNPLMRIKSKGAITPRIKKLEKAGFLRIKLVRNKGRKMLYFDLTEQVDNLFINMNRPIHENEQPIHTDEQPIHLNERIISIIDSSIINSLSLNEFLQILKTEKIKESETKKYLDLFADIKNNSLSKQQSLKKENQAKEIDKIDFDVLLKYINEKTGFKRRVVNDKVKRAYKARLKEGYTKENILNAINNTVTMQNHIDSNFVYLTPEFFSRASTLDKYGYAIKKQKTETERIKDILRRKGHVNY